MTYGVEPLLSSLQTPEMRVLALALVLVHLPSTCFQPTTFLGSVNCSQGLGCRLVGGDVLCFPGETAPDPKLVPVLVVTKMTIRNKLWCHKQQDCTPCVHVKLRLGLMASPVLRAKQEQGTEERRHGNPEEFLRTYVFLSAQTYHSSQCTAVEVWLPRSQAWQTGNLGSLHLDCFPVAINGELHFTAFTRPLYESVRVIQFTHQGPDCTWRDAKDGVRLCQEPSLEVSMELDKAVLHVWDIPEGQHFNLWLYLNRTSGSEGLDKGPTKLLTRPENVSIPISQVFPCLCLQVWPKNEGQDDSPRTYLCPFANDTEALTRAWAKSRLEVKAFNKTLSCTLTAPCDLAGELVPCWRGEALACHPLHPQLHLALTPHVPQEFPGLRPHPNLCVQVRSNGTTYLQSCLQENSPGSQQPNEQQLLLLQETRDSQGKPFVHVLEQSTWVPIAQAASTKNRILVEALQTDVRSGECMQLWHTEGSEAAVLWICSLAKYSRTHWVLAWLITLVAICCILLALLLKKEALKGWLRILKEDYHSGGMLQGRHVLLLYSPDHLGFERLVGTLAGALTQLHFSVSLELWSRGELGSLGPMQWLHAQHRRVLQEGGAVVLLFSHGAVAACAEWLGWQQKDTLCPTKPDSTFLASLNCVLPDFQAGKASGKYTVACFEELLCADEIPALFRSVPVYPLPSQLFHFLLALSGPGVGQEQRSSLRRHVVWISKSLERAVQECQRRRPHGQNTPMLLPQSGDEQIQGSGGSSCTEF
ncbi:interleukin-17 receptor C [Elgaria multicarinata webbii]|uniref:interleukin-17 receptor C n=1 Tax=Elgaria multicarinata webbii TaxID=159646 RepID=UPI002FCD3E90